MNPNLARAVAEEEAKLGRQLKLLEKHEVADRTPVGTLTGENFTALEALAWHHLFGMVLALKKGRCQKALKNLQTTVMAEIAKGPLQAYGYKHEGYGALSHAMDGVREDIGYYNTRSAYRAKLGEYTHLAGFFWYQLQHLTDIPAYRDDAATKAEAVTRALTELMP